LGAVLFKVIFLSYKSLRKSYREPYINYYLFFYP
jgi:hypothetical protein